MKTSIKGEYSRHGIAYNVYSDFAARNHNILWRRIVTHPAFLIAFLLAAFAIVGTIDYAVEIAEAGR